MHQIGAARTAPVQPCGRRATLPRVARFTLALCASLLVGCESGDPTVPTSCEPGEVGTCKGPGDCDGTAVCQADGLDFGPCQCASDAGSDAAGD